MNIRNSILISLLSFSTLTVGAQKIQVGSFVMDLFIQATSLVVNLMGMVRLFSKMETYTKEVI